MKRHLMVFGVLMLLIAPLWAQSIGPSWDYLRPSGTATGKFSDSLMCYVNNIGDTSKTFYFNGLIPKGLLWLKLVEKAPLRDSLRLPRIEYAFVSEPTGANGTYIGRNYYKLNDSMTYYAWGPGDSAAQIVKKTAKWDTTAGTLALGKGRWSLFCDSTAIVLWIAGDTLLRAFPYDFSNYPGIYGVKWRMAIGGVTTHCSTLVKSVYMTGTKPINGLTKSAQ